MDYHIHLSDEGACLECADKTRETYAEIQRKMPGACVQICKVLLQRPAWLAKSENSLNYKLQAKHCGGRKHTPSAHTTCLTLRIIFPLTLREIYRHKSLCSWRLERESRNQGSKGQQMDSQWIMRAPPLETPLKRNS